MLSAFDEMLKNSGGSVDARAFFVACEEKSNRSLMIRVILYELLCGGNHRCQTGFHIGSAATIKIPVANGRREWRCLPGIKWAGRDDIRMSGKDDEGRMLPTLCPEVMNIFKIQVLGFEVARFKT